MASFGVSQYGKIASFQNNSGSADASAPEGGVYLFASGALGSSKLYLQNEGESSLIDLDSLLDIAGDSGTGTVSNSQTLTIAGGTGLDTSASGQTITFSMDLNELTAAAVDASADSIAIIDATDSGSKKESIADLATAMAGDGLVASAGAFAVNVADMATSMTGDLADTDEFAISDGGTMKKVDFSVVRDAAFADLSGDATVAAGGALTIAADAVENSMLANITRGSVKVGGASDAPTDLDAKTSGQILVGDGTDIASVAVSGDATLAANGALTISAGAVENSMLADDAVDSDELAAGAVDLAHMSVNSVDSDQYVDGSIDLAHMSANSVDSDQYVDGSIDTAHIADDQITNALMADDAIDSAQIALGALDSEHYASGSIQTGHVADNQVTLAKLAGLARGKFIYGDASGDPAALAAGANGKILVADANGDPSWTTVSGDATLSAGALTISADSVENSMLSNIARGSVKVGGTADAPTDLDAKTSGQILVGDGTDIASVAVSGDATLAANGALTISAGAVENSMLADDAVDSDELAAGAVDLAHMSVNSVDSDQYVDGSIDLVHMSVNSVDSDQYVDGSIDLAHMSANSVDSDQYVDGSIDLVHMSANSVDSDQYVDGSIDTIHLADDAVTAAKLADDAVVNASVAAGAAIVATKLNFNVDLGGNVQFGTQSDDTVAFGGPIKVGGNVIANAEGETTISMDNSQNVAIAGAGTFGGGYGSTGVTISPAGAIQANGSLTVDTSATFGGGYGSTGATISAAGALQLNSGLTVDDAATFGGGYGSTGVTISNAGAIQANGALQLDGILTQGANAAGVDAKFFGGDANEYMLYDASENHLEFHESVTGALVLELGVSTNGYALEVAQLAGDAGKIKATAFVTYSDETLKEEVTAMDNALDAVMSLNGVEFTWKNSGERDFGFLAQEVKSVIPQAVSVGSDGIHGVDYSRLTSVLVEAVKAQQVQINDLKKALKN